MFYETQRIINKQHKYVKSRAYGILLKLERGGFKGDKAIDQIDLMLLGKCTETDIDVYNYTKAVLRSRKEKKDEGNVT